MTNFPLIALVGCGAITEAFYLPGFVRIGYPKDKIILVDNNEPRLKEISIRFGIKQIATDYNLILNQVDGAVIATPSRLHFFNSANFLKQGVSVLCEKPLSENSAQVYELISLSMRYHAKILVNNTRRLYPVSKKIKQIIESGVIGKPTYFEYSEGGKFTWPTVSGFYFQGNKGVFIDRGSHVIDLVCWWLGKPKIISYRDDSFGGSEAMAQLEFKINSCRGTIKFNLFNKLRNKYLIKGTKGEVSGDIYDFTTLFLTNYSKNLITKITLSAKQKTYYDFADKLLRNFIDVILSRATPLISAYDVMSSIKVIDYCYHHRQKFVMPWI